MRKIFLTLGFIQALVLSGCSNIDNFDVPKDSVGMPTVKSIVDEIQCELTDIAMAGKEYQLLVNQDYVVAVELDLDVTNDGSLAPAFSYTNQMLSVAAGAKFDLSREQNFTEQLFFSMRKLEAAEAKFRKEEVDAGRPVPASACGEHTVTLLAGDLGLKESAHLALLSDNADDAEKAGNAKGGAFGGYVKFVVTKNINGVGPTWTLTHFKGPGPFATLSQVNTDQMFFAFAKRDGAGSLPDEPITSAGKHKTVASAPHAAIATQSTSLSARTVNQAQQAQDLISNVKLNQVSNAITQLQFNPR